MRAAAFRWTFSAGLVLAAHALVGMALMRAAPEADPDAGSPVVTLELSPISAEPAPPPDDTPTETRLDMAPPAPPVAEATPVSTPPEESPPPAKPPDPLPSAPISTPEAVETPTPTETPDSPKPPPPSPPPTPEETKPVVVDTPPQAAAPPASAPAMSAETTADAPKTSSRTLGREAKVSPAALSSWQRALIAQIERHKRFPAAARGRTGVVKVAFTIDLAGRLTGARVIGTSGSAKLDEAALDLIRHSQPFPAPPHGVAESALSFVAPVRYLAATRR